MAQLTMEDMVGLSNDEACFLIEYFTDRNAQRAATAINRSSDWAYKTLKKEHFMEALERVTLFRMKHSVYDAEWHLQNLVENHYIARQEGKISASNQALHQIGKHAAVDSFAAEKVQIQGADAIIERLTRSRSRLASRHDEKSDDEKPGGVSFL